MAVRSVVTLTEPERNALQDLLSKNKQRSVRKLGTIQVALLQFSQQYGTLFLGACPAHNRATIQGLTLTYRSRAVAIGHEIHRGERLGVCQVRIKGQ